MRIGIVCPYSLDIPGGVQNHVKDLAEALIGLGHDVSVLAPSESDELPPYVVSAGDTVAVPYNGAVARMSFGPVVLARARRWLRNGDFDVLHLHEPATPSLSLLALWVAECPVVATYPSASDRSRGSNPASGPLRVRISALSAAMSGGSPVSTSTHLSAPKSTKA